LPTFASGVFFFCGKIVNNLVDIFVKQGRAGWQVDAELALRSAHAERRLIIAAVIVDNLVDSIGGKALPGKGAWRTRCTAQSSGVVTRYKGGS
jgi:hypothetical protein